MYECGTCESEFSYREDCDSHMDEYNHWVECDTCTRQFRTQRSCEQHMNAVNHRAPVFECQTCTRTFSSQAAVNQHMHAKRHYENYCIQCERQFMNENCLRQHLNSKTHRGTDVVCPFCNARFVTASGITHHLEYGSCPEAHNWNRDTIHRMIQQLDPKGLVTNKQIEWDNETNMRYFATNRAFDGTNWVCYLCQRGFSSMAGLNAHLNSPVHKGKIYHCLNKRGCGKEFVSLGALFSHLESESCGYLRFGEVQNVHRRLNDAILNRRMISGL
ncbi:unnamed protein product [Penicillium glandicola]